jgi:hypothetical protein
MRVAKAVLAIVVALLLTAASASAHHSFAAEFDAARPVNLTGTFTKSSGRTRTHTFISM